MKDWGCLVAILLAFVLALFGYALGDIIVNPAQCADYGAEWGVETVWRTTVSRCMLVLQDGREIPLIFP